MTFLPPDLDNHRKLQESCGLTKERAEEAVEKYPRNPDTGYSGSFTPTRTYRVADGRYCCEYVQTVMIGGEEHQAYGTACRQPDGAWKIVGGR